jgi:hypothetical protein
VSIVNHEAAIADSTLKKTSGIPRPWGLYSEAGVLLAVCAAVEPLEAIRAEIGGEIRCRKNYRSTNSH